MASFIQLSLIYVTKTSVVLKRSKANDLFITYLGISALSADIIFPLISTFYLKKTVKNKLDIKVNLAELLPRFEKRGFIYQADRFTLTRGVKSNSFILTIST